MGRIVSVVVTYWPRRRENVDAIISSLRHGTVQPDEVLVLNNNPNLDINHVDARVINSPWNTWTRGKYPVALMDPADYYMLLDDDMSVGKRTIEAMLAYAGGGDCCYAGRGVILDSNMSFHHGRSVSPHEVERRTQVDTIIGMGQFVSFDAIVQMLRLEKDVRLRGQQYPFEAEDIMMGLCNRCEVLPLRGDENFVFLPENGESLCGSFPDYTNMRDRFTLKCVDTLLMHEHADVRLAAGAPWSREVDDYLIRQGRSI